MKIQQAAAAITANGQSTPWLMLDYRENPFNASLLVNFENGFTGDVALNYIADAMLNDTLRQVSIHQTANTITVEDSGPPIPASAGGNLGHGLAVGDLVQISASPGGTADGDFTVASVTGQFSYTLTSPVSQTLPTTLVSARAGRIIQAGSTGDKLIGASGASIAGRLALALNAPVWGVQAVVTTFTTGGVLRLVSLQGGK